MNVRERIKELLFGVILLVFMAAAAGQAEPLTVIDDGGNTVELKDVPHRVVSLVPSATEIIFAIGARDFVAGITHHSSALQGAADKTVVGGFLSPAVERISALKPDLILVSDLHSEIIPKLAELGPVLVIKTVRMEDAFRHIRLMGRLFQMEEAAEELIAENKQELSLIAEKIARIPEGKESASCG